MQLITRAKETQELWEMLVPHVEPPTLRECAVWCQRFRCGRNTTRLYAHPSEVSEWSVTRP